MASESTLLKNSLVTVVFLFMLGNLTSGCVKKKYTCTSCHTDQTLLEAIADPINYPPSTGEG
jgi:hypothetical protein